MNKNKIIELALKEIKEIETLVMGFGELEQIPAIMFQLADSKVENIRNILNLLTESTVVTNKKEQPMQEKVEIAVIQESAEEADTAEIEIVEDIFIPECTETEVDFIVVKEEEAHLEHEIEEDIVEEKVEVPIVLEEEKEEEIVEEKEGPKPTVPIDKKPEKKATIGEKIIGKKSSVNEKLSSRANTSIEKTLNSGKITDLKKSINLNDKFRFQKELFKGSSSLMNQTLEVLNETEDKNDAVEFLSSFEWNEKNQTVVDFMELVNRKFL